MKTLDYIHRTQLQQAKVAGSITTVISRLSGILYQPSWFSPEYQGTRFLCSSLR